MTDLATSLLRFIPGCVLCAALPLLAAETSCRIQRSLPPPLEGQSVVGAEDWLRPGNLRFGLTHPASFMPGNWIDPPTPTERRTAPARPIDMDRIQVRDPASPPTTNVIAVNWKTGIFSVATVRAASSDHIRIAVSPISVAVRGVINFAFPGLGQGWYIPE